jgi:hypothetical protein
VGGRRDRILAIAAGLLFAVLPFSLEIGSGDNVVTVHGRPPIVSAWSSVRRGPLAVWTASDETGRQWLELRSGGRPYAAREARERLLGAVALIGGGTLAVVFAQRRRRPSGSTPPLPPPFTAQRVHSPAMKGPPDE